jgi:hypothetical protein
VYSIFKTKLAFIAVTGDDLFVASCTLFTLTCIYSVEINPERIMLISSFEDL